MLNTVFLICAIGWLVTTLLERMIAGTGAQKTRGSQVIAIVALVALCLAVLVAFRLVTIQ